MKRLIICLSAALVSLAGCSDDEDIQPAQKEKIVSFLTGTHAPRLVAEENLEEGTTNTLQPNLSAASAASRE